MKLLKLDVTLIALLGALALSSVNSKAMGLAWFVMTLSGLWALFWHFREIGIKPAPAWLRIWLIAALLALLFKALPTAYWSDPWSERHGEMRLALGALGIWGLQYARPREGHFFALVADALTLTSGLGLIWVVAYGRHEVATHPIPWAAALAMISACLLAMALQSAFSARRRAIWLFGGLLAILAVLSSRSRGAYGIVIWWVVIIGLHVWRQRNSSFSEKEKRVKKAWSNPLAMALAAIALTGSLSLTPILQSPIHAIQVAFEELRVSSESIEKGANSSVGARIYMWSRTLETVQASPWIGLGHDGRKSTLVQWADDANSTEIKRLGHVHNEFLNQLIDHGVWGLGSQLAYLLAWFWMVKKLWEARQLTAALALSGVAFVHFTCSLSNVNFSHNYYTAALSFFISLSLWMACMPPRHALKT